MKDRELLELAAKAAGFNYNPQHSTDTELYGTWLDAADMDVTFYWQPLDDDGDAFRLAVNLRLNVTFNTENVSVFQQDSRYGCSEVINVFDPLAATRRAIVRAAAEIGKGKA
jgi:hypothetical protein